MKILFRTDASYTIGTGNVIRCLALAQELKSQGHECVFYTLNLPGNMSDRIAAQGFSVFGIPPKQNDFDICVIDHYALQASDEDSLRVASKKLVAIDDWGNRVHRVDLIIDPSMSSQSITRKNLNRETPFESGAEWLMLRDEFQSLKLKAKVRTSFKNILVFFGGTDPKNQIIPYLRAVAEMQHELSHLNFKFLISQYHPQRDEIKKMKIPSNALIVENPNSMGQLILDSDFYLGSSGTITWERMCLGLPGMLVTIVDNQEDIAETLHQQDLQVYLGKSHQVNPTDVFLKMLESFDDKSKISRQSEGGMRLVDGKGIQRISRKMLML